jgi:hypothetical protein
VVDPAELCRLVANSSVCCQVCIRAKAPQHTSGVSPLRQCAIQAQLLNSSVCVSVTRSCAGSTAHTLIPTQQVSPNTDGWGRSQPHMQQNREQTGGQMHRMQDA